jgi:hypothetical protein
MVGIGRYRKLSPEMRIFFFFILTAAIFEGAMHMLSAQHTPNHWLINIYCLVEFAFLAFILRYWLGEKMRSSTYVFIILGLVLLGIYSLVQYEFQYLNKYNLTMERIILLLLSGYFLIHLAITTEVTPLRNPRFWAASGIFIYFTSTIVIFSMAEFFYHEQKIESTDFFYAFHSIINIFGNIIYAIALLCKEPEMK